MIELLKPYEAFEKKGFSLRELSKVINEKLKSSEAENLTAENKELFLEFVASRLHEKSDLWNKYYGPEFRGINKDGTYIDIPSREEINEESITYWERRIDEVQNPILKARYSGLVWEFKKEVSGERPEISICIKHIESIILVANGDYSNNTITTAEQLMRAVNLALTINNLALAKDAFDTLIDYEDKHGIDDKPGLWGFSMTLLLANKKLREDSSQVEKVVSQMEARFQRLVSTYKSDPSSVRARPIKLAGVHLCQYYHSLRSLDKVKDTIDEINTIYNTEIQRTKNSFQTISYIEELMELYKFYGFNEDYRRLLVQLRSVSSEVNKLMTPIRTEFTIEREKFDKYNQYFIGATLEETLLRIPTGNIPVLSDLRIRIKDLQEKNFISLMMPQAVVDKKGRTLCTIGGIREDPEGHLYLRFRQEMPYQNLFYSHLIDELKSSHKLSTEALISHISGCPLFQVDRLEIFRRSFDAFLADDNLIFLHLMVPQIEECCRLIMELNGENVLKEGKSKKSYHLKTFDNVLQSESLKQVFTEDQLFYLRAIYTDPRGFNLRNDICHGMSDFSNFNGFHANLVFNTVLLLCLIRNVSGS